MTEPNPWECSQTDRSRYLRWVWEVSHLPFTFVAFGESRDPFKLKLARSWKKQHETWCDHQLWLQDRGNPWAWKDPPNRERFPVKYGGTEDDIEDGTELMYEIGYYGISDEWKIRPLPDYRHRPTPN